MAAPSLDSPNVGNYSVGKGNLYFKKEGDADFRHMGNVASMEFTATIETLEHFSSMEGVKSKDLEVVLTKGGDLVITLEEWTAQNLGLALLGDVNEGAPGGPEVEIFSANAVSGAIRFIASNEVGPKWDFDFYNVQFIPSGSINPISDEFAQFEVTGKVLVAPADDSAHAGQFGLAKLTNLP